MPGQFYEEGKKAKVDLSQILAGLSELENKLECLVIYRGGTTDPGAADGSTFICSDLAAKPDYNGNLVVIRSGAYIGQSRRINGATTGGVVSPDANFDGQILAGVDFAILGIRTGAAAAPVAAPVTGSATQDWQAAEADVVSIGADDIGYRLHSLLVSVHNLVGTTITARLYMEVNGVERKVYEQAFNATTDPPGLWIVNGVVGIHEVLRVTLQSNDAADNGKAVDYDYMPEVM